LTVGTSTRIDWPGDSVVSQSWMHIIPISVLPLPVGASMTWPW
jgi:hypothetical protein